MAESWDLEGYLQTVRALSPAQRAVVLERLNDFKHPEARDLLFDLDDAGLIALGLDNFATRQVLLDAFRPPPGEKQAMALQSQSLQGRLPVVVLCEQKPCVV